MQVPNNSARTAGTKVKTMLKRPILVNNYILVNHGNQDTVSQVKITNYV